MDFINDLASSADTRLKAVINDLHSQVTRIPQDVGVLASTFDAEVKGGRNDDRKYVVCSKHS